MQNSGLNNEKDALQGSLSDKHFKEIQSVLYDIAGIQLKENKINMVHNRIYKRMKTLSLEDFDEYLGFLDKGNNTDEIVHLVNALTTNVTHFFREKHHFDHIGKTIKERLQKGERKFRIWSGGCSIGPEPYSTAITIKNVQAQTKSLMDVKILGTDIDTLALARARAGIYADNGLRGLDEDAKRKYFDKITDPQEGYQVKPAIRDLVFYNYLNLNQKQWPMRGPFDFIFCRNVLIYFDKDKQQEYVTKMINLLKPDGFLYLGHSEHFVGDALRLKALGNTIYQKP